LPSARRSNFEIARLDFWQSDAYMAYFDHLDKSGGFFYERWGDGACVGSPSLPQLR